MISVSCSAPVGPTSLATTTTLSYGSKTLSFGSQGLGTATTAQSLTLTNSGSLDAQIKSISTSSTDFALASDNCPRAPTTLAAGASCTLQLTFTPSLSGAETSLLRTTFVANGTTSAGTAQEADATLTGNGIGIPVVRSVPSATTLSSAIQAGQGITTTVTFGDYESGSASNTGVTYTCLFDQIVNGMDDATVDAACTSLPGAATFNTSTGVLSWTPDSNTYGTFEINVVAATTAGTGGGVAVVTVPAPSGQTPFTIAPTGFDFGSVVVGATGAKLFTITNSSPYSVYVSSITMSDPAYSVTSSTCPAATSPLTAGSSCTANILFTPTASVTSPANIVVTYNTSATSTLSLTGTGVIAPVLGSSVPGYGLPGSAVFAGQTATVDFGNVQSGTASDSGMAYTCLYDQVVDGAVSGGTACTSLPGVVAFSGVSGALTWTPSSAVWGAYEIGVTGTNAAGSSFKTVVIDVRQPYSVSSLFGDWDALFSNLTFPISGTGSAWRDLSGNARDGSFVGTAVSGPTGSGSPASPYRVQLDGSAGRVDFGTITSTLSRFQVDSWVSPAAVAGSGTVIAGDGGGTTSGFALRQSKTSPGHVELVVGSRYYPYQTLVLRDHPTAYWRLDETAAVAASGINDSSGNSLTASVAPSGGLSYSRAGAIAGDSDPCIGLDGVSGYISIPDNTLLKPTRISVEAWILPFALPTNAPILIKSTAYPWADGYGLAHYSGTNDINFYVNGSGAGNVTATLPASSWVHVVGTYDGANLKLYLNGALAATQAYSAAITHSASALTLGKGVGGYYWNGALDEVAIYDYALSPSQIADHYTAGNTGTLEYPASYPLALGPTGYWRLGELGGGVMRDSSGHGLNGTYGSGVTLGVAGAGTTLADQAASFNGINSSVTVSNTSALGFHSANQMSIAFWYKPGSVAAGTGVILDKEGTGNSGYQVYRNGAALTVVAGSGSGWSSLSTGSVLSAGSWYHVVYTEDGSNQTIYVNGASSATSATSMNLADSTTSLVLGSTIGTIDYEPMTLGQVALFGYALPSSYVSSLYAGTMTVAALGPQAFWRLNELSGSVAYDSSGNGSNGSYSAVTLGQAGALTGDGDTSAEFDGTANGYATIASSAGIGFAARNKMTLSFWYKPVAVGAGTGYILDKTTTVTGISGYSVARAGSALTATFANGTSNVTITSLSGVLTAGAWHHIAAVHTGTAQYLYVNGVVAASGTTTLSLADSTSALYFGRKASASANFEAMGLDDVAFYDYALTSTEIQAIYASSAPWKCETRSVFSNGIWGAVSAIFDGTFASLYVNGRLECTVATGTSYAPGATGFSAGATAAGTGYWAGSIGALRIYSAPSGTTAKTDFDATADRFRVTSIAGESAVTGGRVLLLDASDADGVQFPSVGCALVRWLDLSSSVIDGILKGFASGCASDGWQGAGTGASPYALALDGATDWVDLGSPSQLRLTGALTVEAWVKAGAGSADAGIFGSGIGTGYELTVHNGTAVNAYINGTATCGTSCATGALAAGWHQVAMTWDGTATAGQLIVYVDGGSAAAGTATASGAGLSSWGSFRIGKESTNFAGSIARISVYNRALSGAEITTNCNASSARFTGLVCH